MAPHPTLGEPLRPGRTAGEKSDPALDRYLRGAQQNGTFRPSRCRLRKINSALESWRRGELRAALTSSGNAVWRAHASAASLPQALPTLSRADVSLSRIHRAASGESRAEASVQRSREESKRSAQRATCLRGGVAPVASRARSARALPRASQTEADSCSALSCAARPRAGGRGVACRPHAGSSGARSTRLAAVPLTVKPRVRTLDTHTGTQGARGVQARPQGPGAA